MDLLQQPHARQSFIRPEKAQDWEPYKEIIAPLYMANQLSDVMKIMERDHNFKATINQYKKQFSKWGLDRKYIRAVEYEAIIKKRKARQEDGKDSEVMLHGEFVPSRKLGRYEKDRTRRKLDEKYAVDNATPQSLDLVVRTPPTTCCDHFSPSVPNCMIPRHPERSVSVSSKGFINLDDREVCVDGDLSPGALTRYQRRRTSSSEVNLRSLYRTPSPSPVNEPWYPYFLQCQSHKINSLRPRNTDETPVVALLRRKSGVMLTYEEEVEFRRVFSVASELVRGWDNKYNQLVAVLYFTIQCSVSKYHTSQERLKSWVAAALSLALQSSTCNEKQLCHILFFIGNFYFNALRAYLEGEECLQTSIDGMKWCKFYEREIAMSDLATHYCFVGKETFAMPLIRELLGDGYKGALWTWRYARSFDEMCCRCAQRVSQLLKGNCIHSCRNCIDDAAPEVIGCDQCIPHPPGTPLTRRKPDLDITWIPFKMFMLLGKCKKFVVVDMDDLYDETWGSEDSMEYGEWDILCARNEHKHRARCQATIRPKDFWDLANWISRTRTL